MKAAALIPFPPRPPKLADLQRSMMEALGRPLTRSDGMAAASLATAEALVKPNDRLTAFQRLEIYNQQYWWRILGNFSEDFRGLRAVLGQRRFDKLAVAYLGECGSTSWNLRDLGQHLEQYIREHPDYVDPDGQLAMEVVRVEWARVDAFDGPEKPPVDPQKIARTAPGRLRLSIQPYITLLELEYPVDELLGRIKKRDLETDALSNAVSGDRPRRAARLRAKRAVTPVYLAVHRADYSVYFKRLDPEAYRLLMALKTGSSLEQACEEAFRHSTALPEDAARNVQGWFANWMRLGWLC
ncbi:MAG: DNA-binding domain-containing protein [Verrucomicrobiota bacterium]